MPTNENLTDLESTGLFCYNPNISCNVTSEYEAHIKSAYRDHAHGQFNFTYFCEAQLVWDTIMAINALNYLE
jgi:hypothetical protein